MRFGWKWMVALGLWCLMVGTTQAITLYRSNSIALYTLEVPQGANNAHPVNFVDPESMAQLMASMEFESREAGGPIYLRRGNRAIKAGEDIENLFVVTQRRLDQQPVLTFVGDNVHRAWFSGNR